MPGSLPRSRSPMASAPKTPVPMIPERAIDWEATSYRSAVVLSVPVSEPFNTSLRNMNGTYDIKIQPGATFPCFNSSPTRRRIVLWKLNVNCFRWKIN